MMDSGSNLVYTACVHEMDEADFASCLGYVPEWRQDRILSYKNKDDRLRSLACSLLLVQGCKVLGWDTRGTIGENGRPVLLEEGHYISMTHSGDCVAVAFSEEPAGIDVEEIGRFSKERRAKLGKRILTPSEAAYIDVLQADVCSDTFCIRDAQAVAFARIWTRKEAFVKRNGKGLSMDFTEIETLQGDEFSSFISIGTQQKQFRRITDELCAERVCQWMPDDPYAAGSSSENSDNLEDGYLLSVCGYRQMKLLHAGSALKVGRE